MLIAKLHAVIGIWSNYFINKRDYLIKFRINNKMVIVQVDREAYTFFIEDYDLYIKAHGTDIVKYCLLIQKMLED